MEDADGGASEASRRGREGEPAGAARAAGVPDEVGEDEPGLHLQAGDIVEVQCYDDAGEDQGLAVFHIIILYPPNAEGRFARGTFLFCTDQYLQWYEENAGSAGARSARRVLHFCSAEDGPCLAAAGPGVEVTHVDHFNLVEDLSSVFLVHRRVNPAAVWPAGIGAEPVDEPADEDGAGGPVEVLDEYGLPAAILDEVDAPVPRPGRRQRAAAFPKARATPPPAGSRGPRTAAAPREPLDGPPARPRHCCWRNASGGGCAGG